MQDEVIVTQADREAAADLYLALDGGSVEPSDIAYAEAVRRGRCDDSAAVQAFARHRTENTIATEPVAWQDIATAPKDGTALLLCGYLDGPHDPRIKVGGWNPEFRCWKIFGASWEPKFWQPLPPPPGEPT